MVAQVQVQPNLAIRRLGKPIRRLSTRIQASNFSLDALPGPDADLQWLFGPEAPGNAWVGSYNAVQGTDDIKHKTLYDNKGDLLKAISDNGAVTDQEQAIILSIAMQVGCGCQILNAGFTIDWTPAPCLHIGMPCRCTQPCSDYSNTVLRSHFCRRLNI